MNISAVLAQIQAASILLKLRSDSSNPWFDRTLMLYEDALKNASEVNLRKLLGLSRAYLETSSDWGQDFFIEIDKTEQLIKAYLDRKSPPN